MFCLLVMAIHVFCRIIFLCYFCAIFVLADDFDSHIYSVNIEKKPLKLSEVVVFLFFSFN